MELKYIKEKDILIIKPEEEIDHHASELIRRRADHEIQRYLPKKTIFDFSKVSFMDSAGIGLIIGRYKIVNMLGGTLEICNASQTVSKILEMAGIAKLINITNYKEEKDEDCV